MRKSLSLLSANVLFLVTMLLIITLGSVMQLLSLTWGLIGTELLLILLPAVLLFKIRRIPLVEGLRLKKVSLPVAAVSVLLGISTFLLSIYIEGLMMKLTGMVSVSLPEGSMPKGELQYVLYFIALALAAPLCEEILFRGAIQGAYENHRKPVFAITITAVMFAFYHFRLTGLPALLPVAFILGYVTWRTQSLIPAMLIHFGMNGSSAANTIVALQTEKALFSLTSPWLAVAGIIGAAAMLYALHRLQPTPVSQPIDPMVTTPVVMGETIVTEKAPAAAKSTSWLGIYWPLGIAGLLYLAVAGLTLMVTLFPEIAAVQGVSFETPDLNVPYETTYQIENRAGEVVGEATCRVEPAGGQIRLDCTRQVEAYEAQVATGFFSEIASTTHWTAAWDSKTLALLDYTYQQTSDAGQNSARLENSSLIVESGDTMGQADLPNGSWIEFEWPWRAAHVLAQVGAAYKVPLGSLFYWEPDAKQSTPRFIPKVMRVLPLETIETPAGHFDTWKVQIGDETAWFASNDKNYPGPVQYDDGMVTYKRVR